MEFGNTFPNMIDAPKQEQFCSFPRLLQQHSHPECTSGVVAGGTRALPCNTLLMHTYNLYINVSIQIDGGGRGTLHAY